MYKVFICVILLLFCSCSWNHEEIIMETTWQAIHALDWGTTLNAADQPNKYREINPILGEKPTRGQVNAYMFTGAILHVFIVDYLPRETHIFNYKIYPRKIFQRITIGISGMCIINNYSIGLRVDF